VSKPLKLNNKSLIHNEKLKRDHRNIWRKISKELVLWKGVWRDKELFDKNPLKVPISYSSISIDNITRPIMKSRTQEGYIYYDKATSIQNIGENWIDFYDNDSFSNDILTTNVCSQEEVKKSLSSSSDIKIFSKNLTDREIEILNPRFIEYLLGSNNKKSKSFKEYECDIIYPLYIRSGRVVITQSMLFFYDDLHSISQTIEYNESSEWK
jgi:hypothetical protein